MQHSLVRTVAIVSVTTAAFAVAHADWPVPRHDPQRTGATGGVSDLRTPRPYWRTYLGGRVQLPEAMPLDVGGPGAAYVSGGRVVVATAEGVVHWRTPNLAITALVGLADLDGAGGLELVARSTAQVFVIDAATGELRWTEQRGEMGTIGGARVMDVDGDGLPEVVVQECYCCQIRSGETGFAYSFRDGVTAPPTRLWRLPSAACGGSRAMLADDVDGDGDPDMLLATHDRLQLLDGPTGQPLASTPALGTWLSLSYCEAVDLVAGGGKELVCALGSNLASAGTGHRVFALGHRAATASLDVLWSTSVGDLDTDLVIGAAWVRDLDGDGAAEIAVSGTQASGARVTQILDAGDGTVLASILEEEAVGAMALRPDDLLFLTRSDRQVTGWRFRRDAMPRLELRWRLKDRRVLGTRDWALAARQPLSSRVATTDIDGDGSQELLAVDTKRPGELIAYDVRGTAPATLATWTAAPGAEVLVGWIDGARALVSTSDGRLTALGADLRTTLGSHRVGGYYDSGGWLHLPQAPVAAALRGGTSAEVVISDSRRYLLALDARDATNAAPPARLWEHARTFAPAIVTGLDGGAPAVACRRTDEGVVPAQETVAVIGAGGQVKWERTLGPLAWNDVLPGRFDADGVPDLVVQWGFQNDLAIRTSALSGASGEVLWTNVTTAGEARFPSGVAVADWNGDGLDDVVFQHYGLRVLSGLDGAQIASGGMASAAYWMPTLVDVTGDGAPEVTLHGGFWPLRTLRRDLTAALWVSSDDERPYPYAAVSTCGGSRPVLVSGSLAHPARLKITDQAGASPGASASVVLAGGRLYADEAAAEAAGQVAGQLTSVHVHGDLTGQGHPTAVVGSTDGWLYGVDPCSGTLDFSVAFDAPVGAVAFADTDGNGTDDLLVSVADGFLYGLRHAPLPGPIEVRDIDLGSGSSLDVDEVTTRDTLSAAWDPVPGATGYQVAVAMADGGYLTSPAWFDVDSLSFTRTGLPLVDGARYVIAVRARSPSGVSPDILSDGVIVRVPPEVPADAGPDAGGIVSHPGGCCSVGTGPGRSLPLALVVFAVLVRRRRRAST